jgi:Arc/MetJ-type ribon-helix-helix transcriptional regulator
VTPEFKRALRILAAVHEYTSMSELMREAIMEKLDKLDTDVAEKMGVDVKY